MAKKDHHFTAADVLKHQEHHGGVKCTCGLEGRDGIYMGHKDTCPKSLFPDISVFPSNEGKKLNKTLPKPVKMTRPEKEMGMILEAQKRAGEIVDYRFQGMSLAWGRDPETGILMRYKCDWVVFTGIRTNDLCAIKIVECKGKHIFPQDMIRFKGCRAEWPMFQFEMWQLSGGEWRRVA